MALQAFLATDLPAGLHVPPAPQSPHSNFTLVEVMKYNNSPSVEKGSGCTQVQHPRAPRLWASPAQHTHTATGWPHKRVFSLSIGTFWQGNAGGGDRARQLSEHCPTLSPFGEQRALFRERPTSPFPPGTVWSSVLRARDTADAEQCSPASGLQSQPSACQQGRHYPVLKLIFCFSGGISSLPL